jgi:PPM family protein phosphatase
MLCSDGLWSGVSDELIGALGCEPQPDLRESLASLGERAVSNSAPYADNTSAAAIRWLGP